MAAHASSQTTKLYRRAEEASLDEVGADYHLHSLWQQPGLEFWVFDAEA